ncbi:hypothetical protein SD70_06080 [Gordoniibacillus kamchatkensis]|uniref:Uncharacterized protein n=1 Tax=Gordoniibacillus kamchatkensis TaxID=1590651 RepID=A0ABR5AL31_9BACL|nr:hypothetical protein [Paenibacillus sp. VKM B-2647]KIL41675.1 hypothetical protein SD70_06080 [Paenibacillus sp. VKM B-2647]
MFRLPFLFIATGLACFALFDILTLSQAAAWIAHPPRTPSGWFHVHLLVLGWATMIAMGAVYQLIHVVLQKEIFSRKLGYVHYAAFTAGTAGLLAGFVVSSVVWIAVFAVLAWIGIVLFTVNIAMTLFRAAVWNPITLSTAGALGCLVLTGTLGLTMGLNFGFNLWPEWHERLLHAHIWIGTLGWFGLLITGFSYKMLPMFYLAHGVSDRTPYTVLILWTASVLTGAIAFLTAAPGFVLIVPVALLTSAVCVYNVYVSRVRKARHKKSPGAGIAAVVISTRALAAFCTLALLYMLAQPARAMDERMIVIAGWAYLWGWVGLTILGYLSKIVPFLWWTHKYGPLVGKKKIPTMGDLLEDRYVAYGLAAIAISLLSLIAGLLLGQNSLIEWSGAALSFVSLVYVMFIGRVFAR